MAKNLVIVESPAKAKTLKKFLGVNYKIEASVGHVRDLPKSELGVAIENDFEPKYITIRGMGKVLAKLRKEVKNADRVFLATDPDREGEAISWHLVHALNLDDKTTFRITFNEITKNAVKNSIKNARAIDMQLVDAQQARRVLDRIVGYKIGPLLWKKVKKGLSAGRVQSAGLKLICDREEEIDNFVQEEYWTIDAALKFPGGAFTARLTGLDGGSVDLSNQTDTDEAVKYLKKQKFTVSEIKKSARVKKAVAPFITSTLQQEASKLLGFATNKTMLLAQQLYEGVDIKGEGTVGLITYTRTDSFRISDDAYTDVKNFIIDIYGDEYLNPERPEYKSRGRIQDAHEAVRPSYMEKTPESIKDSLSKDQFRLYKLIWERFVASQMSPSVYDTLSVKLTAGKYQFRAAGSVLKFDGYLLVYKRNDDQKEEDVKIPAVAEGDKAVSAEINPSQHFTQPPARFNEAMLVKTLEELGIGRPSTYSAIISTLLIRGYILRDNKTLYSTELGMIVNEIMENNFDDIVDAEFTAKMEADLDKIEEGGLYWKDILREFYAPFEKRISAAEESIDEIEIEDEKTDIECENCGRFMVIKYGRFGKFLACPGFPECRNAKSLFEKTGAKCPLCTADVVIKKTKKGRRYYGCENADCEFISWNRPSGGMCPRCGLYLVEKGKNARVACSDAKCGYIRETVENDDDL